MTTRSKLPAWGAALRQRIRTLAWLKALGNTLFLFVFFQLYLAIQKHPAFDVTQVPGTSIDSWIGFQPWTIGLYLSLWVYTALPVALQPSKPHLVRYSVAMTILCGLALVVFYFWPTSVSDAVGPRAGGNSLFALMYSVDDNGNACPSLHVSAAIMSGMWLHAILRRVGAPGWLNLTNWLWCAGIVYSTMATKQHLMLDVLAGAALGWLAGWWSLHRARSI